ncbi:hypothetical protein CH333_08420 [candidate division WOR-3 bacterium JGI_Cruoil_03_44_89]|uniref:Metallo-beta-lactamase domain-containing protein n=1 Tax=candidate division WOR-3 bacterium JGI_Cruoil_03_44_89 TaxID=1973748 RepID=A0A235BQ19_UNCW3|nr:MAG: hypothetical protein CH333_08420 [candidate division WOR-3 bacterium JGI_Cruoil_03_44_89]
MNIVPIAFDSLGTRSMATYIEAGDVKILIDPAVSLAPSRFKLPPHPKEIERQREHWQKIVEYGEKADVIIVTHYHYDHHNPEFPSLYDGKVVFLKDPDNNINRSQRQRAGFFIPLIENGAKKIEIADGTTQRMGDVRVRFSPPVFHGTNPRLGFVVEVSITHDETFLFTSDVEGPAVKEQMDFILEERPRIIFCDGPMTYMLGYRYSYDNFNIAKENLKEIIKETGVEKLVLDHHLARDIKWRNKMEDVFDTGERYNCGVLSAAGFWGIDDDLLEARRRELYGDKKGIDKGN